jgi:hypothetical protein
MISISWSSAFARFSSPVQSGRKYHPLAQSGRVADKRSVRAAGSALLSAPLAVRVPHLPASSIAFEGDRSPTTPPPVDLRYIRGARMPTPVSKSTARGPRSEGAASKSAPPHVRIKWSEKELVSLAKLLRSEPAKPTEALIRAMKG